MEYNTQRDKLVVPEYGRNVQKMVDICMTMEDREKRNAYAKSIIVAMSQVNPKGKDSPHYLQTLWDHLFIISDYKLDVDSPYEKPKREERDERPEPLKYKSSSITYRPYGAYLEKMIKRTIDLPEGEEKQQLIERTAQEMKKLYLQWNIDTCDDEVLKNIDHVAFNQEDLAYLLDDEVTKIYLFNNKFTILRFYCRNQRFRQEAHSHLLKL